MADEIVHPADVSVEMLEGLLEAAFIEHRIDDDGDLMITERYKTWLTVAGEGRRIKMFAIFGFVSSSTHDERLAAVNRINDDLIAIRAAVPQRNPDLLELDYCIMVDGGVTRKSIVKAVKVFGELIDAAIDKITDLIE